MAHACLDYPCLGRSMDPRFAYWYLWAKDLHTRHPNDPETALLVTMLGCLDDLRYRQTRHPQETPESLTESLQEGIGLVVQRLLERYPNTALPGGIS